MQRKRKTLVARACAYFDKNIGVPVEIINNTIVVDAFAVDAAWLAGYRAAQRDARAKR